MMSSPARMYTEPADVSIFWPASTSIQSPSPAASSEVIVMSPTANTHSLWVIGLRAWKRTSPPARRPSADWPL